MSTSENNIIIALEIEVETSTGIVISRRYTYKVGNIYESEN